jgi:integrase
MVGYFNDFKIKDINKQIIQNYVIFSDVSTKSTKDHIVVIKQTLNYLFENGLLNEFSIAKLKHKKQHKNKIEFLKKDEYKKIKKYCLLNFDYSSKFKYNLGVLIALSTGMRIGEICALEFEDLDFKNDLINVRRTLQRIYIPGEGTKVIIGTPKSNSSVRIIPMTKYLRECLLTLKKERYVIGTEKPVEPRLLRKGFNKILKENQMDHYKFHSLRHTFATLCISSNIDIKTVSELLGHANAKMTLDIYTHTTLKQKTNAINILESL